MTASSPKIYAVQVAKADTEIALNLLATDDVRNVCSHWLIMLIWLPVSIIARTYPVLAIELDFEALCPSSD